MHGERRRRDHATGWALVAFPLAVIAVFTALPTAAGVALSLFEWDGGGAPRFIGLENYRALFADDPQLWYAFRNTVIFAVATVPVTTVLAFLIAVALHARWFVGRGIARTILFLPTVVSVVAVGFVWRWILDPQSGLLDAALRWAHLDAIFGGAPPLWLGDTGWALVAIIVIQIWRSLGFCVVLYLAALGQLPRSMFEAAGVDGAGSWGATIHLTWPAVRRMTAFLVITGAIWALQVFDLTWVLTWGAETRWTDVLNVHLYREFAANRLGYAAAIGTLVLGLSAIVTLVQFRWFRDGGTARRAATESRT